MPDASHQSQPPLPPAPARAPLAGAPSPAVGLAAAVAAVALTTLLIYPLREVTPPLSTGVVYLLPVLVVSTFWGLWLGLTTAVASALAFNFFHIQPTGRFTISDPEHLVALAVFLIAAVIASWVSGLARARAVEAERRRREADIAAEVSRILLGGESLAQSLPAASDRMAALLGRRGVALEMGAASEDRDSVPLRLRGGRTAAIVLPDGLEAAEAEWIRGRIGPSLAPVLDAAVLRDSLQEQAIEARALRRSDSVKTALLRSVSHDLRSPLTAIIAGADALGSPALRDDERRELSAGAVAEAERLSRLVDQLLDLSRIEAGAAEPNPDWSSLEEILASASEQGGERVELVAEGEVPLIRADPTQLERAFSNLVENGLRHSAGETVTVTARRDGGQVIVRVVDRGPGIPAADLGRIFDPFVRVGEQDDHPGSGLGLAIAKGFVEANGGSIRAESLPGQGAAFVVALPAEEPGASP